MSSFFNNLKGYIHIVPFNIAIFNPIQDGQKVPHQFFPIISTNVRISLYNFLSFSFNPFATLMQHFKTVTSAIPKFLNLMQEHLSKKLVYLVKSL